MYCSNCGHEFKEGEAYCSNCGASADGDVSGIHIVHQAEPMTKNNAPVYDDGSAGWAVLGFFVPLAGLILFLVWKDEKPRSSKMAGVGALIYIGLSIAISILRIIIQAIGAMV